MFVFPFISRTQTIIYLFFNLSYKYGYLFSIEEATLIVILTKTQTVILYF